MASHKNRPEGGAAKGCISYTSLLHSIWDTWVSLQLPWQGVSQKTSKRQRVKQTWGGLRRGSPSAWRIWLLTWVRLPQRLCHLGWEVMAWLSRKKDWWLGQRKVVLPNPPCWFRDETLTTVPSLPSAAQALGGCRNPQRASLHPRSLTTMCPPATACQTASLVMSAKAQP